MADPKCPKCDGKGSYTGLFTTEVCECVTGKPAGTALPNGMPGSRIVLKDPTLTFYEIEPTPKQPDGPTEFEKAWRTLPEKPEVIGDHLLPPEPLDPRVKEMLEKWLTENQGKGRVVVAPTRLHQDDLAGKIVGQAEDTVEVRAGCVVLPKPPGGLSLSLRCPCGDSFRASIRAVLRAEAEGQFIKCGSCMNAGVSVLSQHANRFFTPLTAEQKDTLRPYKDCGLGVPRLRPVLDQLRPLPLPVHHRQLKLAFFRMTPADQERVTAAGRMMMEAVEKTAVAMYKAYESAIRRYLVLVGYTAEPIRAYPDGTVMSQQPVLEPAVIPYLEQLRLLTARPVHADPTVPSVVADTQRVDVLNQYLASGVLSVEDTWEWYKLGAKDMAEYEAMVLQVPPSEMMASLRSQAAAPPTRPVPGDFDTGLTRRERAIRDLNIDYNKVEESSRRVQEVVEHLTIGTTTDQVYDPTSPTGCRPKAEYDRLHPTTVVCTKCFGTKKNPDDDDRPCAWCMATGFEAGGPDPTPEQVAAVHAGRFPEVGTDDAVPTITVVRKSDPVIYHDPDDHDPATPFVFCGPCSKAAGGDHPVHHKAPACTT